MFRRQLQVAWAAMAALALIQGSVSWWAIQSAARQVEHGRVASDLLSGFQRLSLTKQELREWLADALLTRSYEAAARERLVARMYATLNRLNALAVQARELDRRGTSTEVLHEERARTLKALELSLKELDAATLRIVAGVGPGQAELSPGEAWDQAQMLLALSEGERLPILLSESALREQQAVTQKRADADQSLHLLLLLALGATVLLTLVCSWLAIHFGRALRAPLERLARGVDALQQGHLDHRIEEVGHDEFARFAQRVNLMAQELERHRAGETLNRQQLEALVAARTHELQQALDTLQDMDVRRRQLFADIGHELRTPTTAIRGEAEIALRGKDKPVDDYQDSLRRIADAARHLGGVIDDLLTLARADVDHLTLERQPVLGSALLEQALDQIEVLAQERRVTLARPILPPTSQQQPPGQPPEQERPLLADPQRLRQLLVVLLDNAVRYSRPGGVVRVELNLETRAHPDAQAPPGWTVRISDQGIGIAPADVAQVFDRHFRSAAARRHRADGSGLGLAIGRLLAQAHGGHIALQSEENVGTTVTLWLPFADGLSAPGISP